MSSRRAHPRSRCNAADDEAGAGDVDKDATVERFAVVARAAAVNHATMKIILTGASGFVGEGVLLECLAHPEVESVVSLARKPGGRAHPKLKEMLVKDFRQLDAVKDELRGFDACFYCAGISSAGMNEADYTVITCDTPLAVARVLLEQNPSMTMCHVSGASTDGTGAGKVMWARVKGKTENALAAMPFKKVYNFRPALMTPTVGQKNVGTAMKVASAISPFFRIVFPDKVCPMRDVGLALINAVRVGADKAVLEVPDIRALAAR